jgi:hypothetical protein
MAVDRARDEAARRRTVLRAEIFIAAVLGSFQVVLWTLTLAALPHGPIHSIHHHAFGVKGIAGSVAIYLVAGTAAVIWVDRLRFIDGWFVGVAGVWLICLMMWLFSTFYYFWGDVPNWNKPLTHGDAVFLAIGTLTTGASGITPMTGNARGLMGIQMAADLFLLVLVGGFVIDRLTTRSPTNASAPALKAPGPPSGQRPPAV